MFSMLKLFLFLSSATVELTQNVLGERKFLELLRGGDRGSQVYEEETVQHRSETLRKFLETLRPEVRDGPASLGDAAEVPGDAAPGGKSSSGARNTQTGDCCLRSEARS